MIRRPLRRPPETKTALLAGAPPSLTSLLPGTATTSSAVETLRRSPWAWAAVRTLADHQARLPVVIRVGDRWRGEPADDQRLADQLNRRPNPSEPASAFRFRLSTLALVSPRGAFVEVADDGSLWLLDPDTVQPIVSADRLHVGWRVHLGDGRHVDMPLDRVVWVRCFPHPTDRFLQLTPLDVAREALEQDAAARRYQLAFLHADGRPGGILAVRGELDEEAERELRERWQRGPDAAGRVSVLEADQVTWVDTVSTPRDAEHVESRALARRETLAAFGVPESVATGNAAERTFSNADAEWLMFWVGSMLGHLAALGAAFDQLAPDGATVGFDLTGVDVLEQRWLDDRRHALEEVQAGVRSVNEWRRLAGLPEVPGGDNLMLPAGLEPFTAVTDRAPDTVPDI